MTPTSASERFTSLLGLAIRPVAIAFRDDAPPGVGRIPAAGPSGCSYWKLAAEGGTFYTEASDHFGCPVGAYTHSVELPAAVAKELEGLVGTMVGLEYLTMDDVAALPRLGRAWRFAVYSPLADSPGDPDVVLVRADVRRLMLLSEAAQAAGVAGAGPTTGRPTCAVLPLAIGSGRTSASFGCVGNRVYTGTPNGEGWFAIPGAAVDRVVGTLETIVRANVALEQFHRARAS
jgi:uncharacterized protein (DUF169 family)